MLSSVAPSTETLTFEAADPYTVQAEQFAAAVLDGTPLPFPASDAVAIKTLRSGGDQISVPVKDLPARFAALNVSKDEYGCL